MPKLISEELWEVFAKLKIDKHICEYLAIENWGKIVGETLSSHTHPRAVKNGVLYVDVDSSIWAQELSLLKPKIIEDLNNFLRYPVIKDIVFLDKGFSFRKKTKKAFTKSKAKLSLREEERIAKIVEVIKDEELKEIFKKYFRSLLILQKGGKDGSAEER
ncbi:MAG: DciA family protein [Dictyoglomaceae bacterium]